MNSICLDLLTNRQFSLLVDAATLGFTFYLTDLSKTTEKEERLLQIEMEDLSHFVVPLSTDTAEYCFVDTNIFEKMRSLTNGYDLAEREVGLKLLDYYHVKQEQYKKKLTELLGQIENHTHHLTEIIKNPHIQAGDLPKSFATITASLSKVIDVTRVSIWKYDRKENYIECLDLYEKIYDKHSKGTVLYQKDFPNYFKALENDVVINADNAHTNPYTFEFSEVYLAPLQIFSMLDVPFYVNGQLAGVICFEHQFYFRKWKPEEIMFTTSMCAVLSITYQTLLIKQNEQEIIQNNQHLLDQRIAMEQARNELIVQNEELTQSQEQILSQREFIEKQNAEFKRINEKLQKGEEILKKSVMLQREQEKKLKEQNTELQLKQAEITAQNEELNQQHEELEAINDALLMKNELIEAQRAELHQQYAALDTQQKQLKEATHRLNKSIEYAQSIQNVVLPEATEILGFFSDYFTIYKPKDVVSGDFYWFHQIDETKAIFILADCTGHGVAGAFMSMIGNSLLYKLIKVKELHNPSDILQNIHRDIFTLLKQQNSNNKDGMDIAICLFEKQTHQTKVTFAGAKSMIIYTHQGDCVLLQGDRISIGGTINKVRSFNNQEFALTQGDKMYFFSDGYIDQNDIHRQRFGTKRFQELIDKVRHFSLSEQKNILLQHLSQHQADEEQRDDISVVGIML
jgi:serine phosphatase RsbU (regulator of sigma subunit)